MNSLVFVRRAQAQDADLLLHHQQLSIEESANYRGNIEQVVLSQPHTWVAGFGSTIFASLTAGELSTGSWHVSRVFVEPEARQMGIGDALLQHVLTHIAQSNGTWVSAHAQPGDRSLKNLFERHGLVAQTITVGKSLSVPSTQEHASQ